MFSGWRSCRLEEISQRGVCRNNGCQTQPKGQAPATRELAYKKDPMPPCLPSLAAHWAPRGMFNWTSPGLGCTPRVSQSGRGAWPWNYFFFYSPGKTTQLKHSCRAGDAQMLKTQRWRVREEERRRDLEKHCSQVFLGRGRGQWKMPRFKEKRGQSPELGGVKHVEIP